MSGPMTGRRIDELDTPALLVGLAQLARNVATMVRVIVRETGIRCRPHTKSIKVEEHGRPPHTARSPLGRGAVRSLNLSAEHGTIELAEPTAAPAIGARVEFVVGYCDSTLFLHDELYGVQDGRVEAVWPILGRGKTR